MKMRVFLIVAALLALESCNTDGLAGRYVGAASGFYRLASDGSTSSFSVPTETLVVTATSRHYQAYTYDLHVHGCTIPTEGEASHASMRKTTCRFEIPNVGPVDIEPSGGVSRTRGGVHLTMGSAGLQGKVTSFGYILDAKPQ